MANAKAVASASPNNALQGDTLTVEVTDPQGAFSDQSQVQFNPPEHITVNSITPVSPTVLQVNLTIDGAAVTGARDMFVGTPPDNFSLAVFRVNLRPALVPTILSIVPSEAGQSTGGNRVTINGQDTNFDATSRVAFTGLGGGVTAGSYSALSATALQCSIGVGEAATPGPRDCTVTTGSEIAFGAGVFTVLLNPMVIGVVPDRGTQNSTMLLNIQGRSTSWDDTSTVSFSGTGVTVLNTAVVDATHLQVFINISATASTAGYPRDVIVTTGSQVLRYSYGLQIIAAVPAILSITPRAGAQGDTFPVQIIGQNANFGVTSQLSFSNPAVTASNVSAANASTLNATLTIGAAAAAGTCDVIVTTGSVVITGAGMFQVVVATVKAVILREGVNTYLCQNHISDPATVDICEEFIESVHQALRDQQVLHTATGVTVSVETTATPTVQEAVTLREAINTYLRQNHITNPIVVDLCETFIELVNQALRDDLAGAGSGVVVAVGVET